MIPSRVRRYFITTRQRTDGDNVLTEGTLTCCDSHELEVRVAGEVKHALFSKMYLLPIDDRIALEVCCKKCGEVIPVFDSNRDGYDKFENKNVGYAITNPLVCKKCSVRLQMIRKLTFIKLSTN